MRSRFILAGFVLLLASACSSSGPRELASEEETIYTCIYHAMDEAVQARIDWVEWESDANNCSLVNAHRGQLLLKEAEIIQNRVCAEFFVHFQMYNEEGWQDYIDNIITACRHPKKSEWFAYKGDHILDTLILDEILNK